MRGMGHACVHNTAWRTCGTHTAPPLWPPWAHPTPPRAPRTHQLAHDGLCVIVGLHAAAAAPRRPLLCLGLAPRGRGLLRLCLWGCPWWLWGRGQGCGGCQPRRCKGLMRRRRCWRWRHCWPMDSAGPCPLRRRAAAARAASYCRPGCCCLIYGAPSGPRPHVPATIFPGTPALLTAHARVALAPLIARVVAVRMQQAQQAPRRASPRGCGRACCLASTCRRLELLQACAWQCCH